MMRTLGKTVHTPYTLPPAIEAAIAKEITTPLHERYKSSFLSSLSSSLPPLPSTPSSSPSDMLPPCHRFRMASPYPNTTGEATVEALLARLHRRVEARRWALVLDSICTWRWYQWVHRLFELAESSSAAKCSLVFGELFTTLISSTRGRDLIRPGTRLRGFQRSSQVLLLREWSHGSEVSETLSEIGQGCRAA
ncbi:hypothetical protein Tco_0336775 [Tanacetum coccineum]